jgi:hypothetical protein
MNASSRSSRSFLSSRSFVPFLAGAAVGALAVIWTADQGPPPPCTPQARVKEQAQTPPSAPALPTPEQRVETISAPAPVPAMQEPGRTTVETHTLAERPTLPPAQAPAPAKVQAKAHHKAKPKPKPKAPEPAGGYWNSGEFAAGLH